MFCPKCGQKNEDVAQFCQSCGNDLGETRRPLTAVLYAGFWQRVAAVLIDSIVVGAATGILTAITFGAGLVAVFFLHWIYEAVMLSSVRQATVGKMVLGIVVTDYQGGRLTFARATGRHFAKWISFLLMGIGYLMAAFTEKKQALHDMIAETLVVSRQP